MSKIPNHVPLRLQLKAILEVLREHAQPPLRDFEIAARWGISPGMLNSIQKNDRDWRTATAKKVEEIVDAEIAKGTLLQRRSES
jgi:hypothetical protein